MSGPICPDCHCPTLTAASNEDWNDGKGSCPLCGWEGTFNPGRRITLMPDHYKRCADMHRKKEAGQLFFIRIFLEDNIDRMAAMRPVREILNISSYTTHGDKFVFLKWPEEPDDEMLEKIRAAEGIEKVTVF